jgi:cytidylate kinase
MAIITISRELGSEGDKIADLLCEELGYCRVDKELLMHIAEEAGLDVDAVLDMERSFSQRARLISSDLTSLYGRQPSAFERKTALDDRTYREVVRKTMERFAQQGDAIIVGRGGQMVLRDWPTALHVHLYAPLEVRVRRVKSRLGITEQEATGRINASDEQKKQYIRHMHNNANWKDLKYYHLTINTHHIAPEVAAQTIIVAAKHIDKTQTGA